MQVFRKYVIYYPSELEISEKQYPAIVICNGSGTPISKYPAVPKHYASWGFIVIGTEEENAWNGFGAEMSIRHLQRLNDNEQIEEGKANIFYQKVDFSNVGIVGHSQGGVGVLNAITAQAHRDVYKAAVSLSPTNKELAHALEWDYDAALVDTPIMLISGAGGGDDWVVTGEQLQAIYGALNGCITPNTDDRNKVSNLRMLFANTSSMVTIIIAVPLISVFYKSGASNDAHGYMMAVLITCLLELPTMVYSCWNVREIVTPPPP